MEGDARDFISGIIFVDTTQNSAKTTLMPIIETVRLIMADISSNHNKHWTGFLHDDGSITSENGRVGVTTVSNTCRGSGKHDFDKLVASKRKKGYTDLRTVATSGVQVVTPGKQDLHQLATDQIQTSSPLLTKLIKLLVEANVHNIVSSSSITYNASTGLFQTPLGVVEKSGIEEARVLLADLANCVQSQSYDRGCVNKLNQYFSIVPTNVGMKRVDIRNFIPDMAAVQKQLGILDSLDASLLAMAATPANATATNKAIEKVFSVKLGILEDDRERGRLENCFYSSNHRTHGYGHVKIQEIYSLDIEDNVKKYETTLGNVQEVYHGSGMANCLSILKSGIRCSPPSSAAIAGKMWGNGIYGAIDSSKSLQYTYGRFTGSGGSGSGWLFILDMAMGKTDFPRTYGGHLRYGHDSIWAKKENTGLRFDELIVYRDSQVKIKYLIEVK